MSTRLRAKNVLYATTSFFAIGLIFQPSAFASTSEKWAPWLEIGGFLSNERDRAEANVFVPLVQDENGLAFADLKGKLFEDGISEGNFAVGYRQMTGHGWNFGLWGGFDTRYSELGNRFNQISFGAEALSADFDLRLNGYVSITNPKGASIAPFVLITGSQIFLTGGGQEVPLSGFDGEVGGRVLRDLDFVGGTHNLRLYGGGFYFDDDEASDRVAGPRVRAEWRLTDFSTIAPSARLTLEASYQHDSVRNDQSEVGVRLRLPLSNAQPSQGSNTALSAQARRMTEALVRDTDIVTTNGTGGFQQEAVVDAVTGIALDRVVTVTAGGDLTTEAAAAGANSLIIINGTATGGSVAGSQTLVSGGSSFQVRGQSSGTVVSATAPGSSGVLQQGAGLDVLTIAGNFTHAVGLTLDGNGNSANDGASMGSGLHTVVLDGLTIRSVGGDGIDIGNANTATLNNISITSASSDGLEADTGNVLTLNNVSITNAGAAGILLNDTNTLNANSVTVAGAGTHGIEADDNNNITMSALTISNATNHGVFLDGSTFDATNLNITGAGAMGVFGQGSSNRISVASGSLTNIGTTAFAASLNSNLTLTDVSIDGASNGVVGTSLQALTIRNSSFANISGDAIELNGGILNMASVSGTTFSGTMGNVFNFAGPVSVTSSTANVDATTSITGRLCEAGTGSFSGTIGFTGGLVLQDNVAPCN